MEPLRPIELRLRREVDPVTPTAPVRLTPAGRDAARERREQARKRRRNTPPKPDPGDGHVDLTA